MPTPMRAVRVASPLWEAARARATEQGTTVTAVVVAALEAFTLPPADGSTTPALAGPPQP